ncbi:MAG: hypothetical protein AAGD14_08685 [Planctomycetota bacterium]
MAAAKNKHAAELAKFEKAWKDLGAPAGDGAEQAIRVLLARHGTREGSVKGMDALWMQYVGINELRVAQPDEIAMVLTNHVKNDPQAVARHVRGFIRRYFKDHHTLDFSHVNSMTPEALRKYLDNAIGFSREMGLAIFLQLLQDELNALEEPETDDDEPKRKARTEREINVAMDRLRMACAWAAFGESPSKAKLSTAHRKLAEAYKFAPPPSEDELEEPIEPTIAELAGSPEVVARTRVVKKSATKKASKKAASKPAEAPKPAAKKVAKKKAAKKVTKKVAKKKATKKVAKKKATKKVAKKKASKTARATSARPRGTRKAAPRPTAKKSSRR